MERRPSIDEILSHSYLKKYNKIETEEDIVTKNRNEITKISNQYFFKRKIENKEKPQKQISGQYIENKKIISEETALTSSNHNSKSSGEKKPNNFRKKIRMASLGQFLENPDDKSNEFQMNYEKANKEYGVIENKKQRQLSNNKLASLSSIENKNSELNCSNSQRKNNLSQILKKKIKNQKKEKFFEYALVPNKINLIESSLNPKNKKNFNSLNLTNIKNSKNSLNKLFFKKQMTLDSKNKIQTPKLNLDSLKNYKNDFSESSKKKCSKKSKSKLFSNNNSSLNSSIKAKNKMQSLSRRAKRRISDLKFLKTDKNSIASKKSNLSLQIFNSNDKNVFSSKNENNKKSESKNKFMDYDVYENNVKNYNNLSLNKIASTYKFKTNNLNENDNQNHKRN